MDGKSRTLQSLRTLQLPAECTMSKSKESAKSTWLEGKQVACTGSLACMTRAQAADLIHAFGGRFVPSVTRKTNVLLVGQEGWPLQKDEQPCLL